MDVHLIFPLIKKRVKINLRDNFYFIGIIEDIQNCCILFKDKKDNNILIDVSDIVRIEERPIIDKEITEEDKNGFEG